MDEARSEVQLLAQLIQKDLKLESGFDLNGSNADDRLTTELTQVVRYLLDHDFQRLLNALYRIDVSEQKVKEILSQAHPDQLAAELATEILKREQQKLYYRMKYQS